MADAEEAPSKALKNRRYWPRRMRWQVALALLGVLIVASFIAWRSREQIADNVIGAQLRNLGIEASYEIESIGPTRQVLTNFVIGDPARPDLYVERIEVVPIVRWWGASIGSVTLVSPRIRASYKQGRFSLGALDPLLEQESEGPVELPDWRLKLVDARAKLFTDYGVIGMSARGSGALSDGFAGWIAASAPGFSLDGCRIANASLQGTVVVDAGKPGFAGPLNLRDLSCEQGGVEVPAIALLADLKMDEDFSGVSGKVALEGGKSAAFGLQAKRLAGTAEFDWRDGLANATYAITADAPRHPSASLEAMQVEGALRFRPEDERIELDLGLEGNEIRLGEEANRAISEWREAVAETLAEPLLKRFETGLKAALPGSTISAEMTLRRDRDGYTLLLPAGRLRDRAGTSLLALSQGQFTTRGEATGNISGNFATGGQDLPDITGRMERSPRGTPTLRLQMAPYRAGSSSLALPQLVLAQGQGGGWGIAGSLSASGALPGGMVDSLEIPLSGGWSESRGLAMWNRCTDVSFNRVELASLRLGRDRVTLCPAGGQSILRSAADGIVFAASTGSLELAGELGDSPIRLASDGLELSSAEGFAAKAVDVVLGPPDATSRLSLAKIDGKFGTAIEGTTRGIAAGLAAVPLDISGGSAVWQFADGELRLSSAEFELRDRVEAGADPRFYPMIARDAALRLSGDVVEAAALLRNPASDRAVVEVKLRHTLSTAMGHADLLVPQLAFDDALQPDQLSILADGVIALAEGVISGQGVIDWDADKVTSSGAFSSDDFDFAAAFGPVQQVSGTVRFSDLLNLTTDGTQSLKIGSINPGVEVFDGIFDFAIRDGTNVSIRGGRWPFFGGTMELRPTELNLAASEVRNYVIEISGADAAQFIAQMELGNISATGIFDGTVPLVFDEDGNGEIKNGLLISRPPGGNLSYVGELTYEDMGAIANFAFQSLRSLDFTQMMVEMNGPLTGEIITRLLFDGVRQGEGTSSNFVTRQIAKLPIRFNVNIRAAFYELLTSLRSTYDPAFIRDPRDLGLLGVEDGRFVRRRRPDAQATKPEDMESDEPAIQRQESEPVP